MINLLEADNLLSIWNSLKDSVRQNTTRGKEASSLDYSFITPTLLALGKLPENKADELVHILQGSPALIWNLSGKPFSSHIKSKFKCQILDAAWVTPGQFTQAPSLECIFSLCYSIKSWLDLRNDHVAIVHCANGRSRSGILVACLLKYIGAFEHSSHAFDFFCSARLQSDTKPVLAPSYRILFENIDKAVDHGGYPNPQPMHLKCIAVSGLPVDEIPCVEVWDMAGQLFASHVQWKHTNKCTWSADYGDGFFRVAQDLQGDFSVLVRFGGHHALTRDKTTLIFKYQNSSAFLPPEVVELKRQNVDVNPEYSDSLEVDMFAVHLMFEAAVGDPPRGEHRAYQLEGKIAFEWGLDEISKFHSVEPDSVKGAILANMGLSEQYTSLALQLSNNVIQDAAEYIKCMKARSLELGTSAEAAESPKLEPASPIPSAQLGQGTASSPLCYSSSSPYSISQPAGSSAVTASTPSTPVQSANKSRDGTLGLSVGPPDSVDNSEPADKCATCREDSIFKRDQLILCSSCRQVFHTACMGARRIPFSLKTPRERQNRDKYISKHFGTWRCTSCDGSGLAVVTGNMSLTPKSGGGDATTNENLKIVSSNAFGGLASRLFGSGDSPSSLPSQGTPQSSSANTAVAASSERLYLSSSTASAGPSSSAPWSPTYAPSGAVGFIQGAESASPPSAALTPAKTKHDQAAILMGLLASTGITVEQLMHMGEDKQREALIAAASMHNKSRTNSESEPTSVAVASISLRPDSPRNSSPKKGIDSSSSRTTSIVSSSLQKDLGSVEQPEAAGNNGLSSSSAVETPPSQTPNASANGASENEGPAPRDDTISALDNQVSAKLEDGAPVLETKPPTLSDTIDNLPSSKGTTESVVGPVPLDPPKPAADVSNISTAGSSRAALMEMLAKRSSQKETGDVAVVTVENPILATGGPQLQDDARFAKYIKMVKVGLPKGSVAAKMVMENVVSTLEQAMEILNMAPTAAPPTAIAPTEPSALSSETTGPTAVTEKKPNGMVPIGEHPLYNKFFKMVKVGLPKENIKLKMQQESVNPDWLDKDPSELVPLESNGSDIAKVAVSEHPQYAKYFRMLQVGLPKNAIKAKMVQEGKNPDFLDKAPREMISSDTVEGGLKVPVGEHPLYSKFFKMLKVGLPKENIKAKMAGEGLDPSYIDKDHIELVPLDDSRSSAPAAAVEKGGDAAVAKLKGPRKKKLHWKGLDASKVGRDSLWADNDDGMNIKLDEAEFNQLFVESESSSAAEKKAADEKLKDSQKKKARVNVIDMKRAQNGGIALARIRVAFSVIKARIEALEDEDFTTDQLRSLEEFLPNADELHLLRSFRGDKDQLGPAEKYMIEMKDFPSASKRIQCMIFKQQFRGRITEIKTVITLIENACDDVKLSVRLKKVLKTILKVGNQMNDGAEHLGFTLDALLKLQSAKAFDKKTSVLQYVIMLIQRNDEDSLLFPEDLVHVAEASRLTMESVQSDQSVVRQDLDRTNRVLDELREQGFKIGDTMLIFLDRARQVCDDIDKLIEDVSVKYNGVLAYFGEDSNLNSSEFFSTLSKFITEFIKERDVLERQRRADLRKKESSKLSEDAGGAGVPSRRASIQSTIGGSSQRLASGIMARSEEGKDVTPTTTSAALPAHRRASM